MRKPRKRWYYGVAAAATVALIITLNFGKSNMVHAIEQAFKNEQSLSKLQIEVPVDLKAEEGDQKNADAGHSPWKLDPVFVAQVFASLKLSPKGIQGDYPIKYEELKFIQNNGKEAVVEVGGNKTIIRRVYLKRLIRQDSTGIWTVVGYDPVVKK